VVSSYLSKLEKIKAYLKDTKTSLKTKAAGRYSTISKIIGHVPSDPKEFYRDFGLLEHPLTSKPVQDLTSYQKEAWHDVSRYRYVLNIKSNKIGLSTSHLLCLFYHMITDCIGYQALIIAQSMRMSREHLYTLHKMILNSEKYRPFLISIGDRDVNLLREETSRVTEMFIRNPMNPHKPSRIIAIPANAGSAVSWKEVKYIMCSDITMTDKDYDPTLKGLFTRLANTQGYFVIETIPNGPQGLVYDAWLRNRTQQGSDFKVREYPVLLAVEAGLINEEFLEKEKQRHGLDFDRLYNCSFAATGGNVFNLQEVEYCVASSDYDPEDPQFIHNRNYPKSIGVDPGYRTSKAGIVLSQMRNGEIEIIKSIEMSAPNSEVVAMVYDLMNQYSVENIFVDVAASAFISDLKDMINEHAYNIMKDMTVNPSPSERIVPVTFHPLNRAMLIHANQLVSDKFLKIDNSHQNLLNQMRIATHVNGKLVKNEGSTMDLVDALFLTLLKFQFEIEKTK
jgi:hypothetical protein